MNFVYTCISPNKPEPKDEKKHRYIVVCQREGVPAPADNLLWCIYILHWEPLGWTMIINLCKGSPQCVVQWFKYTAVINKTYHFIFLLQNLGILGTYAVISTILFSCVLATVCNIREAPAKDVHEPLGMFRIKD